MKIWFIDDDLDDLEMIESQMQKAFPNIEVSCFTKPPAKLDCHALFIDLCFGRLNGYDVATEYRKKGVKIPIVVLTGNSEFMNPSLLQHIDGVAYKKHPSSLIGAVKALEDITENA